MKTLDTTSTEDARIEQFVWESFAHAHPHEAHETDPDRFWQHFHQRAPEITREQMVALLKTNEP